MALDIALRLTTIGAWCASWRGLFWHPARPFSPVKRKVVPPFRPLDESWQPEDLD
jgi:hypothetical protein